MSLRNKLEFVNNEWVKRCRRGTHLYPQAELCCPQCADATAKRNRKDYYRAHKGLDAVLHAVLPLRSGNPIIDGQKVCNRGHRYDPSKKQCPDCAKAQQRFDRLMWHPRNTQFRAAIDSAGKLTLAEKEEFYVSWCMAQDLVPQK